MPKFFAAFDISGTVEVEAATREEAQAKIGGMTMWDFTDYGELCVDDVQTQAEVDAATAEWEAQQKAHVA